MLATFATGIGAVAGCVSSANERDRETIVRHYAVSTSTGNETVRIAVPKSVYQAAREATAAIPDALTAARNSTFLTDLVQRLTAAAATLHEALRAVRSFVDSIDYATDQESTGRTEYVRRPSETLVDGEGDCDDKAVLLAGLLSRPPFEYQTGLVFPPNHCATLAPLTALPAESLSAEPLTVTVDRTAFVYLESVAMVPAGHWAADYGEDPILASYTDFWHVHDVDSLLAAAQRAVTGNDISSLRAFV
ncbi:hypothetical protein [Natrinema marinum]|uniref:hypothetical protein n=1 Tax=Natrinema marinum TaxID=2961598 RepID=UPI0020C85823|nr:hypothetical protein [Natrinema marinum]